MGPALCSARGTFATSIHLSPAAGRMRQHYRQKGRDSDSTGGSIGAADAAQVALVDHAPVRSLLLLCVDARALGVVLLSPPRAIQTQKTHALATAIALYVALARSPLHRVQVRVQIVERVHVVTCVVSCVTSAEAGAKSERARWRAQHTHTRPRLQKLSRAPIATAGSTCKCRMWRRPRLRPLAPASGLLNCALGHSRGASGQTSLLLFFAPLLPESRACPRQRRRTSTRHILRPAKCPGA